MTIRELALDALRHLMSEDTIDAVLVGLIVADCLYERGHINKDDIQNIRAQAARMVTRGHDVDDDPS